MEIRNARAEGTKQDLIIGYRLGLYDPDPDSHSSFRFKGRIYRREESHLIRQAIADFNELAAKTPGSFLCLAAFPVSAGK